MYNFLSNEGIQLLLNSRLPIEERTDLNDLRDFFVDNIACSGYFLVPSSGSSKQKDESVKLIVLKTESILNSARRVNKLIGADAHDHWALVLPEFHVAGLGIYARASLSGAKVFKAEWKGLSFDEFVIENKLSFSSLVPTQVEDLIKSQVRAPANFKCLFVGGGALNAQQRESLNALGWPFYETYGMTETCSMIAVRKWNEEFFQVLEGVNVQSDSGQIKIQCDSLMSGYLQKKRGRIEYIEQTEAGWYQTEDLGEVKYAGGNQHLKLNGRASRYLKILGEGVSLDELNSRIKSILKEKLNSEIKKLKIEDFEVLAIEDSRAGAKLYLVFAGELDQSTAESVFREFNSSCRPYEKLSSYVKIDQIPRTELGKLKAQELKSKVIKALGV